MKDELNDELNQRTISDTAAPAEDEAPDTPAEPSFAEDAPAEPAYAENAPAESSFAEDAPSEPAFAEDAPAEPSFAEDAPVPETDEQTGGKDGGFDSRVEQQEESVPSGTPDGSGDPYPAETPAGRFGGVGTPPPVSDGGAGEARGAKKSGKGVVIALVIAVAVFALVAALLFNLVLTLNRKIERLNERSTKYERTIQNLQNSVSQSGTGQEIVIQPSDPKSVTVVTVNDSVVRVAQECSSSVVTVKVTTSSGSGSGSGVIWTEDGYIVTNNHVVEDAVSVKVTFQDGKTCPATVIAVNADNDLALIRINRSGLKPVTPGSSEDIVVGETAIAIGNPLGTLANTVTDGVVSALARNIVVDGNELHVMQISCAINPGNSGGGCFNAKGELIGIVNAKKYASGIEGLGFAIPVDTVKTVVAEMLANDKSTLRKSLGLTSVYEVNEETYSSFSSTYLQRLEQLNGGHPIYGIYIYGDGLVNYSDPDNTFVSGDVMISIDGKEIRSGEDINELLESKNEGDELVVRVKRMISSGFFSSRYSLEEKEIRIKVVMMYR